MKRKNKRVTTLKKDTLVRSCSVKTNNKGGKVYTDHRVEKYGIVADKSIEELWHSLRNVTFGISLDPIKDSVILTVFSEERVGSLNLADVPINAFKGVTLHVVFRNNIPLNIFIDNLLLFRGAKIELEFIIHEENSETWYSYYPTPIAHALKNRGIDSYTKDGETLTDEGIPVPMLHFTIP